MRGEARARGMGKGELKKWHMSAVTQRSEGKVLNKEKYFFFQYFDARRTLEPLGVKKWLCCTPH